MGIAVNLDNELVNIARSYSGAESRSVPKQIEHWAKIGRIAEENPDLSYDVIRGILLGLEDVKMGNVQEYNPDSL
jgi:ParD-like antitoxin of type II bacterial toxin-antitoxin system